MPSYYDLPLLKPPVWTWEVPTYFFIGGAAGAAAVLAAAAQIANADETLVRDARWIAAIGANLSTPLLIADLGRPERFLNMLRVFKVQSPMSVGAWTVAVFGGASTAAVIAPWKPLRDLAAGVAALSGLVMSTYTGVLLGAAASLLELRGHRDPALNALGLGASLFESAADVAIEEKTHLLHIAGALAGPVPFLLRLFGKRKAAAVATLLGSAITRFAWVEAGKKAASK